MAALKLYQKGTSIEDIADILGVTVKEVEEWLKRGYNIDSIKKLFYSFYMGGVAAAS